MRDDSEPVQAARDGIVEARGLSDRQGSSCTLDVGVLAHARKREATGWEALTHEFGQSCNSVSVLHTMRPVQVIRAETGPAGHQQRLQERIWIDKTIGEWH